MVLFLGAQCQSGLPFLGGFHGFRGAFCVTVSMATERQRSAVVFGQRGILSPQGPFSVCFKSSLQFSHLR